MERTKPYIGSNDQLDELAEQEAEWQRANHEAGECLEDCPYCELERHGKNRTRQDCASPYIYIGDVAYLAQFYNP